MSEQMTDHANASTDVVLNATIIAVGHCVILNECERPYGNLVAVVVSMDKDVAFCKYLNAELHHWNKRNRGRGMQAFTADLTPVEWFGVEVVFDPATNSYNCERVGESRATYRDKQPRLWQENVPISYFASPDVAKLAIPRKEPEPCPNH